MSKLFGLMPLERLSLASFVFLAVRMLFTVPSCAVHPTKASLKDNTTFTQWGHRGSAMLDFEGMQTRASKPLQALFI